MVLNDYTKSLEAENAALRKSIHSLEDELKKFVITKEDIRGVLVTHFDIKQDTNVIMYQGKKHFMAGRHHITMTLDIDAPDIATKLRNIFDKASGI